jgi:hypothetical protein
VLSNTGTALLTISSITPPADFAVLGTSTCGASLAPGANCNIDVNFAPTAAGPRNGLLTISSNDLVNPVLAVTLIGAGIVPPPAAPTLSASVIGPFQVNLSWTPGAGGGAPTGFRIERDDGTGFAAVGTVAANVTTFSDTTVKDGTQYSYRGFAFNATGDSPASNVVSVTTPLAPPSNLAAAVTPVAPLGVILTWTNNSLTANNITIQRALNASFTLLVTNRTVPANTTTFTDTNFIVAGVTYYYRIRATNTVPPSAWSNVVAITPRRPAAPSNLAAPAATVGRNSVGLTWTDNSNNEGGFTVQRATNPNFTVGVVNFTVPANTTSFTVPGLNPNTAYYFRVRAFNGAGNSGWANGLRVVTLP